MLFRSLIALTIFMILSPGCIEKKRISGDEFVERDVLVDMLVDLHLADGVTNDRKFSHQFEADSIDLLSPILEKYHVTHEMFDTTMALYSRYPSLLDEVYNEVLIKLNVLLDETDKMESVNTPAK